MTRSGPIRVLIADGSKTARAALNAVFEADQDFEVVAEAVDGAHAVELARMFHPAVVLMDVDMSKLDGFEATRRIMTEHPTHVIMVSAQFEPPQVHVALQAVRAGALTVVPKPSAAPGQSGQAARLGTLVKALADVKVVRQHRSSGEPRTARRAAPLSPLAWRGLEVVGVAASTGGPAAVFEFLRHLPPTLDIPVVVVQHIASGFVDGLASWLAGATPRPVLVAYDGEPLRPGHVYIAPDHRHLRVRDGHMRLSSGSPGGGFCPSADVLFASLADAYGASAAGVVLSGMGHDGVEGCRQLRDAGGLVVAQDDSSVIFGMPRAVAAAGLAHRVGTVEDLAAQITGAAIRPAVAS